MLSVEANETRVMSVDVDYTFVVYLFYAWQKMSASPFWLSLSLKWRSKRAQNSELVLDPWTHLKLNVASVLIGFEKKTWRVLLEGIVT